MSTLLRSRLAFSRLFLLLGILALAGCSSTTSSTPSPTSAAASPTPTSASTAYVPRPKDVLKSVYMVSASDGWAVGSSFLGAGARNTLILHYNGNQWEQVSGPDNQTLQATTSELTQVFMVSAAEGWAIGDLSSTNAQMLFSFILHYTGGRWTLQVTIPNVILSSLAMLSATDGWAAGATPYSRDTGQQGVLLHYTGGTWTNISPFGITLDHIVMTSPDNGWIVGTSQPSEPNTWHYNGSAWTPVSIPGMDTVSLISMVSANDGWAVGFKAASTEATNAHASKGSGGNGAAIFAHYDGKTWTASQTFTQDMNITSISLDSSSDGWAVGALTTPTSGVAGTNNLYLHYTGGQWTQMNGPAGDGQLTVFMLSASDGWAVGDNAAILHYQNGAWNVVVSA